MTDHLDTSRPPADPRTWTCEHCGEVGTYRSAAGLSWCTNCGEITR